MNQLNNLLFFLVHSNNYHNLNTDVLLFLYKKISVLGVKKSTIDKFGAVSEECVLEMNEGLYDKTSADVCVSVSGIAGPDGGSLDKPVGTVCIGFNICGKSFAKTYKFRGGRNRIRMHSKNRAFFEIIKVLEQI